MPRADSELSGRSKRRKIVNAKETIHHVPATRCSAKAALAKWQPYMYPLFALTELITKNDEIFIVLLTFIHDLASEAFTFETLSY